MDPKLALQIVNELAGICQGHYNPSEPHEPQIIIPPPENYVSVETLKHRMIINTAKMASHYHTCSIGAGHDRERSIFFGARSMELQLFAATLARNVLSLAWKEIHVTTAGEVLRHKDSAVCALVKSHRLNTWAQRLKAAMAENGTNNPTAEAETSAVVKGKDFKLSPLDPRISRVHTIYLDLADPTQQHPDSLALAEASAAPAGFLLNTLINLVFASADLFPKDYDPMTVNFNGTHIIGKLA